MTTTSFRPTKENKDFLASLSNKNSFLNQIIDIIRTGKVNIQILNESTETTVNVTKSKKEELNQQKIIAQINSMNQRILESQARTRWIDIQADAVEKLGAPISNSGRRILAKELKPAEGGRLVANQAIFCPLCDKDFRFSDDYTLFQQKDAFADHYFEKHASIMPKELVNKLQVLKFDQ